MGPAWHSNQISKITNYMQLAEFWLNFSIRYQSNLIHYTRANPQIMMQALVFQVLLSQTLQAFFNRNILIGIITLLIQVSLYVLNWM